MTVSNMVFCHGYDRRKRECPDLTNYEIYLQMHKDYKKKPISLRSMVAKRLLQYSNNITEDFRFELEELLLLGI